MRGGWDQHTHIHTQRQDTEQHSKQKYCFSNKQNNKRGEPAKVRRNNDKLSGPEQKRLPAQIHVAQAE